MHRLRSRSFFSLLLLFFSYNNNLLDFVKCIILNTCFGSFGTEKGIYIGKKFSGRKKDLFEYSGNAIDIKLSETIGRDGRENKYKTQDDSIKHLLRPGSFMTQYSGEIENNYYLIFPRCIKLPILKGCNLLGEQGDNLFRKKTEFGSLETITSKF